LQAVIPVSLIVQRGSSTLRYHLRCRRLHARTSTLRHKFSGNRRLATADDGSRSPPPIPPCRPPHTHGVPHYHQPRGLLFQRLSLLNLLVWRMHRIREEGIGMKAACAFKRFVRLRGCDIHLTCSRRAAQHSPPPHTQPTPHDLPGLFLPACVPPASRRACLMPLPPYRLSLRTIHWTERECWALCLIVNLLHGHRLWFL